MSEPTLSPVSTLSAVILPASATFAQADAFTFPMSVYSSDGYFLSGAADQVAYTYRRLGGDVLDIELTKEIVFSNYQDAVLEYSYLLNIHQAKNSLGNLLGSKTGSFDEEGQLQDNTDLVDVALKFPRFKFEYARRVGHAFATEAGYGGVTPIYSASFSVQTGKQDYDLQAIISSSATTASSDFYGMVGNNRVNITKVYYKTPQAVWRFYGYYGGLNTVGNLSSYGQYADDSTFEVIPAWQNKLQSMAFEDAIYTRNSHFSYEIKNNKVRIYPAPAVVSPKTMWVEFFIDSDTPWQEVSGSGVDSGVNGINNINSLPFENIPYQKINAIGKQWIRRFALALSKESLGLIREKFDRVPIPGDNVTLNGPSLIAQAKETQEKLREELKEIFDDLTYDSISEKDSNISENINNIQKFVPLNVYTG